MPESLDIPYRTYADQRSRGSLDLSGTACPLASCRAATGSAALVLSKTIVLRWIVLLERDAFGEWSTVRLRAEIALGYCEHCKARPRLLPCDVLPHKQYTLPVIEFALLLYRRGDLSLRVAVAQILGTRTPVHTSLHAWSEGLGAFALGIAIGELRGAIPASALFVETERHFPTVEQERQLRPLIPPVRYRSPERKERLDATFAFVACSIIVAATVTPPGALTEWSRLLLGWVQATTCPLGFRSGLLCTGFEQATTSFSPSSGYDEPEEKKRCPDRSRSPPGASSR